MDYSGYSKFYKQENEVYIAYLAEPSTINFQQFITYKNILNGLKRKAEKTYCKMNLQSIDVT